LFRSRILQTYIRIYSLSSNSGIIYIYYTLRAYIREGMAENYYRLMIGEAVAMYTEIRRKGGSTMLDTINKVRQFPCPACGSTQSYFRMKNKTRACRNCGNVWTPEVIDVSGYSDKAPKNSTRKKG